MYRITETRPSIVFAMSRAVRAMDRPTEADWIDVRRILSICGERATLVLCKELVTVREC